MKKSMLRFFSLLLLLGTLLLCFVACGPKKKVITIYASSEDIRIENAQRMLDEKFPEYDVRVEYMSTGDLANKLKTEGKKTDADIVYELETVYMASLGEVFAVLEDVDFSVYLDELVPESHRYIPLIRTSGAIVVNKKMLTEKGLATPTSYDDLLKEDYKGLISMSNPKSSGTGYIFYLNMVNEYGLDEACAYFGLLSKNLSGAGFTSSGSGPIQQLRHEEAAIALGMTFQAVNEINQGADWEILFFEEGSPYNTYSCGMIEGRQDDEDVKKVFDYLVSDVIPKDNELFTPEKTFKNKDFRVEGFPENIPYADMTGLYDSAVKERLLKAWSY